VGDFLSENARWEELTGGVNKYHSKEGLGLPQSFISSTMEW